MISVITVVYNGVKEIESTIRSVLDQRYDNIEYIVIDGKSNDGTNDVIRKYAERISYWMSEQDKGIYDAMNKGITAAHGEWMIFMNAGDRFAGPDVLNFFEEQTFDAGIVYGEAIVEYPGFNTFFKRYPLEQMWKRMPFCHQATFVRTALMKSYGFDLRYRLSSDFNFLYKAYLAGIKFQYINKVICHFDFKGGASKKQAFLSFRERKQIVLGHTRQPARVLYYLLAEVYLYGSSFSKQILGNKVSGWLTRLLRK